MKYIYPPVRHFLEGTVCAMGGLSIFTYTHSDALMWIYIMLVWYTASTLLFKDNTGSYREWRKTL